jgi:hypothetical protein
MLNSRRGLLRSIVKFAPALAIVPVANIALGQIGQTGQTPRPMPSPHAPDPNFPPGLDGPDIRPGSKGNVADPQIQVRIKADVEQLFEMASDLKQQVEKSDTNSTLSLSLVKKAQQIEKLAKEIKNLAKG